MNWKKLTKHGMTSDIFAKENVVKKVFYERFRDNFNREVQFLQQLQQYNFVPRLIDFDANIRAVYMQYVGKSLLSYLELKHKKAKIENCPPVPNDWEDQHQFIMDSLKRECVYHGNMHYANTCVMDNQIYIIDFGSSSMAMSNRHFKDDFNRLFKVLSKCWKYFLDKS